MTKEGEIYMMGEKPRMGRHVYYGREKSKMDLRRKFMLNNLLVLLLHVMKTMFISFIKPCMG